MLETKTAKMNHTPQKNNSFGKRAICVTILAGTLLAFLSVSTPKTYALDNKPYDARLLRLAEILGSLHYLRALCGAREGQLWRNKMQEIVQAEGTSALRRAKLVKRFNKGYRSYRQNHRTCTDAARLAVEGFMTEGAEIAERLATRNR